MASYFNLELDTTGPASPAISINGGDALTTGQSVTAGITTGDGDTTGYQMKIWGDVDTGTDANIQDTEVGSTWIAFAATKAVELSAGDGSKTLHLKIRDDVYNESSEATDSINLDTTVPTVTISSGPDVSVISKIAGKRTASFQFTSDVEFDEYKVKVVPASGTPDTGGTQIGVTNGSSNMSGTAGNYPAATPISCAIDGRDLDAADTGDGTKIIKVFVKATSNDVWSA